MKECLDGISTNDALMYRDVDNDTVLCLSIYNVIYVISAYMV